jgi:hypothetical protein
MVLLSQNFEPPRRPEPLGPIPQGHRRVMFTGAYNLATLNAGKDEVRDVPVAEAEHYVANAMAVMFDDLPPEPEPEPVELERPAVNASKRAWIEWAVSQGANHLDAMTMTKAELQNEYGERL